MKADQRPQGSNLGSTFGSNMGNAAGSEVNSDYTNDKNKSNDTKRRTRFAPSPTGFMHIGNLRSALYAYLISKRCGGDFILRIEDTDQERLVEGATELIFQTLAQCGLKHDEGPDIGGPCAPYTQSERLGRYIPEALRLVEEGKAYYCFCAKSAKSLAAENAEADSEAAFDASTAETRAEDTDETAALKAAETRVETTADIAATETSETEATETTATEATDGDKKKGNFRGYPGTCRNLDPDTVRSRLAAGDPWVIRQKMPQEGHTSFEDLVFGEISVENKELEDQILIKSDGFPTYNFANVIDDHEMQITHVARGCEYLSSTPKYNLLYEALGYKAPIYIHLPLINGKDGKKLSKRHGATSFSDLRAQGYLAEAIINYIAMLGWSPGDTREIFSLAELRENFDEAKINRSPAVFDYEKLSWYNAQYLRSMSPHDYQMLLEPELEKYFPGLCKDFSCAANMLQERISHFTELPETFAFLKAPAKFSAELYTKKKQKMTPEVSLSVLEYSLPLLEDLSEEKWHKEAIYEILMEGPQAMGIKMGTYMGPLRLALSNMNVTPGGPDQMASVLGKDESLRRIRQCIRDLKGCTAV